MCVPYEALTLNDVDLDIATIIRYNERCFLDYTPVGWYVVALDIDSHLIHELRGQSTDSYRYANVSQEWSLSGLRVLWWI